MIFSKRMKNPARWLIYFISSLPDTDETFAITLEKRTNGVEGSCHRAIAAIYRAAGELLKIINSEFSDQPSQRTLYLGWEAPLKAATTAALKNHSTNSFRKNALDCLNSLKFCAAYIDDKLGIDESEDSSSILKDLEDFQEEILQDSSLSEIEKSVLLKAITGLIESLKFFQIFGTEGVFRAIADSAIEFLISARTFKDSKYSARWDAFTKRIMESVFANGVYEIGKISFSQLKNLIGS